MTDTATYLREAREHRGFTLDDVAQATRIPRHYLDMMEGGGDSRLISDRLYLVHYVRQYAAHLQIDEVEQLAAQFIRENNRLQSAQRNPAAQKQQNSRRLVPWLLLFFLVAGVGGAYLYDSNLLNQILPAEPHKAPAITASSMTAEPAPVAPMVPIENPGTAETGPRKPPNEAVTVLQPEAVEITPSQPNLPVTDTADATQMASGSSDSTATTQPSQVASAGGSGSTDARQPREPGTAASTPASAGGQRLEIVATETSWVRVIADGQGPQDAMMQPGDSRAWSAEKQFVLTFGNAGGVDLILNGKKLPALGVSGQVIRNYQLPKP